MTFKRFSASLALILALILSLGLLTSCLSDTENSISIEKDTSNETETGKLDFLNRDTTKSEDTTKSPETTKIPETVKAPETEKVPETTVHTHNFALATCTAPKTCLSCGKTEGGANGHSWESATCTTPKKCADCSETEGVATGHSYYNGSCTSCYAKDPSYNSTAGQTTYVLNTKSKKFHYTYCSWLPTNNREDTTLGRDELVSQGYEPCKRCNP